MAVAQRGNERVPLRNSLRTQGNQPHPSRGLENAGGPGKTRTSDLRFRKQRVSSQVQDLRLEKAVKPPPEHQRLSWRLSNPGEGHGKRQKETAALAGTRSGGEWKNEALGKPLAGECLNESWTSSWVLRREAFQRVLKAMEVAHAG